MKNLWGMALGTLALVSSSCGMKVGFHRNLSDGRFLVRELQKIEVSTGDDDDIAPINTVLSLTAVAIYDDGSSEDVSHAADWQVDEPGVASLQKNMQNGRTSAHTLHSGLVRIRASYNSMSSERLLSVNAANLVSLAITPPVITQPAGTNVQYWVIGTYDDGSTADLTQNSTWNSTNPSVVSLNPVGSSMQASLLSAGSSTISVQFQTHTYNVPISVSAAVLSSIEVTPVNFSIAKGLTRAFQAIGRYSDHSVVDLTSAVTWSSMNASVASVGANGEVLAVDVGSSQIRAAYGAVNGTSPVQVTAATLSRLEIEPMSASAPLGTNQVFAATGVYSDQSTVNLTSAVSWSSSNPGVASISNIGGTKGVAHGNSVGVSTIVANYGAFSAQTDFHVTAATLVSIALNAPAATLPKGMSFAISATGTYSDASTRDLTSNVTWSSSQPSVAAISNASGSAGMLTGLNAGSTVIQASLGSVSSTTPISITSAVLASISIQSPGAPIPLGLSAFLGATGLYSDGSSVDLTSSVTWTSSDPSIASISNASPNRGKITTQSVGTVTIDATLGSVSQQVSFTVSNADLVSISIAAAQPSLAKGLVQSFTATGTYTDASVIDLTSSVTWASSDALVASVSNAAQTKGLVTAIGVGSANISAALGAISQSVSFTVDPPLLVSLAISNPTLSIAKGLNHAFTVQGTYSDYSTADLTASATWSSSNASVMSVSDAGGSKGQAQAAGTGTASVTATVGLMNSSSSVTVSPAVLSSISVSPDPVSIAKGLTQAFTAQGTYSDATTVDVTNSVTWTSSATSFVTISNTAGTRGVASAIAVGSSTISASIGAVNGSATLTVTAPTLVSIAISPSSASVAKGLTQAFVATGTYTDLSTANITSSVTWKSSSANVVISNTTGTNGVATGSLIGSSSISAEMVVGGNTIASNSVTMSVTAAVLVSISVSPTNVSIPLLSTRQFYATGTYTDGSIVDLTESAVWSLSSTLLATVSNSPGTRGKVTYGLTLGTTTITATIGMLSNSTNFYGIGL